MKKLLTLLMLLCMVCTGAWAQATLKSSLNENSRVHVFKMHPRNESGNYWLTSQLGSTQSVSEAGDFIFIPAEGENNYYIYSVSEQKWLTYDNTAIANGANKVSLSNTKGNYFNLVFGSTTGSAVSNSWGLKNGYLIKAVNSNGTVSSQCLNWHGGPSGYNNNAKRIGFHSDGFGDAGCVWVLEENLVVGSDNSNFTEGWYQIQVSDGTFSQHEGYKGKYLKGVPNGSWGVTLTDDATDEKTYIYVTKSGTNFRFEFNKGTADHYYAAQNSYKNESTPGNLTFYVKEENANNYKWKIWGGTNKWCGWNINNIPSIGITSGDESQYQTCFYTFHKVTDRFVPQSPASVTTGWYQIKWVDVNSDSASGMLNASQAEGKYVKNYSTDVTVNGANYPLYLDTDNGTPSSLDEIAQSLVYVNRTSANVNTAASIKSSNGHYAAINGQANTAAQNLYIIYFSSSSYPVNSVVCSGTGGNTRTSWTPYETNGVKYIGSGNQNKYPMAQFCPVNPQDYGLIPYTVTLVNAEAGDQITYNGSSNYGCDKVYNNGVFFFDASATINTEDFAAPENALIKSCTIDNTNHTISIALSRELADGIYEINNQSGSASRGYFVHSADYPNAPVLAETQLNNYTNRDVTDERHDGSVNPYFGVKTIEGKTYIYSLANGKFLNTRWSDTAVGYTMATSPRNPNYVTLQNTDQSGSQFLCNACGNDAGVDGHTIYTGNKDGGNDFVFEAVDAEKATELQTTYADNISRAEYMMGIVPNIPIISLSQLRNTRAYTITSYARGQWTAVAGKTNIYQSRGTEQNNWGNASGDYTPIETSAEDANQQWAILKSANNNYYLYNVGQKKFFISQDDYTSNNAKASLGDTPNSSGFTLVDRASVLGSQSFYTGSDQAVRWGVGMNVNGTDYFFGVTNWTGQSWMVFQNNTDYNRNNDGGMYFKLVPVEGTFDPTEAMAKIVEFETVPTQYTLASAGTPDGASVTINGTTYTGINDQGLNFESRNELSLSDIKVSCGGGYIYNVQLDNANHQINVAFKQLFVPATSTTDLANTYYIYDTGKRYVTIKDNNILHTKGRNGADKFIFLEDTENAGKYFIYDVTAQKYLYWTATSASQNVTQTSSSKIQFTTDANVANSWGILGEDYDITGVDIFAGSVDLSTVVNSTQGWNFRGGNGYVLNFYNRDDNSSSWKIQDSSVGSLSCATLVYSLPGEEFMHKLVPEDDVTVESVDFGDITSLTLKDDRARYKYVSGIAPTEEGTYTYTVTLSDGSKAKVTLKVDKFLQSPTPFMGWLSWNWFQRGINATNMTAIAQGLKDKGLVDAGFTTLVLDDTWANQTSNKAALDWNSTKFPNPTAFVNDINALGLKVGLYSDAGRLTCENFQPGSYGYEAQHMAKFDQWGIDFLKYDRCNAEGGVVEAYSAMGREIEKVNVTRKANGGVPFMYNACEWGDNQPWTWAAEAGASSWRSCHDVREDWCGNNSRPGVIYASDVTREYWMYAGVNRYNDLDMMCIGLHGLGGPSNNTANHQKNGEKIDGLTTEQARSQMSIWCMFASPLSLTADVRQNPSADGNSSAGTLPNPLITDDDLAILTNKDIIAINQDALGQQAEYMPNLSNNDAKGRTTGYSVYLKDLKGGDRALAIVNRSGSATMTAQTFNLADLYLDATKSYYVKDVWAGTVQTCKGTITTSDFKVSETKVYIISEVVEAKVTQPASGHTGGLNGKYVGTFSSSFNVELPEGYKAYTATVDGTNVTFNHLGEEGNRLVPANTGVLLYAEEGVAAQNATPVRFADVEVGENAFRPTTGEEIPVGSYILANKQQWNGVCFYVINPAARKVAKGKAYLELPTTPAGVQAYAFGFDFEQEATTGINSLESIGVKGASYDLQGRRVSAKAKGVTIVNGAKVIR